MIKGCHRRRVMRRIVKRGAVHGANGALILLGYIIYVHSNRIRPFEWCRYGWRYARNMDAMVKGGRVVPRLVCRCPTRPWEMAWDGEQQVEAHF